MDLRERPEGTPIQEGAQVTSTPFADYFYFRRGEQVISVRIPKDPARIEVTGDVK